MFRLSLTPRLCNCPSSHSLCSQCNGSFLANPSCLFFFEPRLMQIGWVQPSFFGLPLLGCLSKEFGGPCLPRRDGEEAGRSPRPCPRWKGLDARETELVMAVFLSNCSIANSVSRPRVGERDTRNAHRLANTLNRRRAFSSYRLVSLHSYYQPGDYNCERRSPETDQIPQWYKPFYNTDTE